MFVSDSQHLEIFSLPAVPTEHLDGCRQPHFPMSLHSVLADALVTDDKVLSIYLFLKNTVLFLLRGGGKSANIISLEYTLSAIALYPSHMTKLILSTPPIPYPLQ